MPRSVWERTLGEIKTCAHTVQFYFQGEPLLNKDLPQMIREAHEAGLYTVVSTNAQAMTPEVAKALAASGLDRIIVSMDGLTQESYGAYRVGGDIEKVKKALQWLQEAKSVRGLSAQRSVFRQRSGLTIELQVLRLRTNEHEWDEFKRVYKSLGADRLVFKTAQLYDYTHGHPLMPSDLRYSRYVPDSQSATTFRRRPVSKGCFRVWSGAVITTTGEVLPCCYDKAHEHSFGNIMDAPLREIYNNGKARAFRRAALAHKPQICHECWK